MATKVLLQDLENTLVPNGQDKALVGANKYYGTDGSGNAGFFSFLAGVIQATNLAAFPATGNLGTVYIAQDTGRVYRWTGSAYQLTGDDEVQTFANFAGFPATGALGIEYIDLALDRTYLWDTVTSAYILQGGINVTPRTDAFPAAAVTSTKTLSFAPSTIHTFEWFRNGIAQTPTVDYTISGTTVTLVIPAFASDIFLAKYSS